MSFWKPVELALTGSARLAWPVFQAINRRFEGKSFQPPWSAAPLLKSRERSSPSLGWPRTTDSLCPSCVRETRARILSGEQSIESLVNQHVGEIPASILERDGKIVIEKTCSIHGTFTDTLAINPDFLKRIESLFPGRDFDAVTDRLHNHGTSSIKHGRGAVLTIDLTNRCNMMCDPCFMDANQVGYVHELTLDDVKQLLDDALSIKPRRQMTVQFSGGEPTISPIFLDAVRYARAVGYFSVQAATNGIRFAQEPEFAQQAREAGLRIAYLQFDGVSEQANSHRRVANLFDVKLRAIENLYAAGIDICLVVTIVNTVNDQQVGNIGHHAGGGKREPVAQRLGHSCLSLQVFREVRQGVALGVALLVRDLFVAAGEGDGLERDEADLVAVLQRELHDRADLIVVDGIDDRHDEADIDASGMEVLDGAQLDVEQVAHLSVRVRRLRDAVELQIRDAHAGVAERAHDADRERPYEALWIFPRVGRHPVLDAPHGRR